MICDYIIPALKKEFVGWEIAFGFSNNFRICVKTARGNFTADFLRVHYWRW